jgi:hypothetical protein
MIGVPFHLVAVPPPCPCNNRLAPTLNIFCLVESQSRLRENYLVRQKLNDGPKARMGPLAAQQLQGMNEFLRVQ